MYQKKKSNKELLILLEMLSKKREKLVFPFLNNDVEIYSKTFKYERNNKAFNLVRDKYFTLWIDSHFADVLSDEFSSALKLKAIKLVNGLLNQTDTKLDMCEIKHRLLQDKVKIIDELLINDELITNRLNELKYSYEKDKALFERQLEMYEKEM